MLTKFFTSVFTQGRLELYIPNVGKRDIYESDPKLEDFLITTSDIHKHIVALKDNKAPGDKLIILLQQYLKRWQRKSVIHFV